MVELICYNFPKKLGVKEKNNGIEFRLPINLPQRVKKLFNDQEQFSGIQIIRIFEKKYLIIGGENKDIRINALLFIFQNIIMHGKPLFDSSKIPNNDITGSYHSNNSLNGANLNGSKKSIYKLGSKFAYHPNAHTNNNTNNRYGQCQKRTYSSRSNSNKSKSFFDNEFQGDIIKSIDDIHLHLDLYNDSSIKNLETKIYEKINVFDEIIKFVTLNPMNDEYRHPIFLKICKIFTNEELSESTNTNRISSIYSIFFDMNSKKFKLEEMFNSSISSFLVERFDFQPIFDFFHVLISISSNNAEMLKNNVHCLRKLISLYPELEEPVEDLIEFTEQRKQMDLDSLESSISPTSNDLFFTNEIIENGESKVWDSFTDYKKAMIDLTKLNFYYPFKLNLSRLRKNELDARDLFLYKNVTINFASDTSYFELFNDCTLFLKFPIRVPPNWTKGIPHPDWKHSERLSNRSLLILSTDPNLLKFDAVCKSCAIARGDGRGGEMSIKLLNKGIVPVTLVSGEISENKSYYMFEPTSCWSAVQPVLQRLSRMTKTTFPTNFLNPITKLDFNKNTEPLTKIISTDTLVLSKRYKNSDAFQVAANKRWVLDDLNDEQKDTLLRVDHEQYDALRFSLNHNLTLVNGAPGTGKTHLAREILRVLNKVKDMNPIAVIAFTNHALDSILEDVIKFIDLKKVIRWGGPMKSENPALISRKWTNRYLEKEIRWQRNNIATKKEQLKNLYNIRQMATISIKNISADPYNVNHYLFVFSFLRQFIKNIYEKFTSRYPLPLNEAEIGYYNEYLKSKKNGIQHVYLPNYVDAVKCWLHGDNYYNQRNLNILRVFNENQRIALGRAENRFQSLFEKDEEEEEFNEKTEAEKDEKTESEENKKSEENITNKSKEKLVDDDDNDDNDDEEEEDSLDEKIYGDEDMIEMIKNSYYDAEIGDHLPQPYLRKYIIENFKIIFEEEDSPKAMIRYLKEMSLPLRVMIKEFEKQLQLDEMNFSKNESTSAGLYLRQMKLIGMTSTIASCYKEALEVAGCEIVIVEEAGELTESMLSCILPKTMKRLILIGDYQQLRPKVEYELTKDPFNYDISLFEKLVKNALKDKAECLFTLSIQRRMHPQISQLIRESFYSDGESQILDDRTTNNHGIPFGMPHRVRFIMHNFEMGPLSGRSYSNITEARFCAALIPFFICRGYKPEDITIISLYKGQKYEIERQIQLLFNNKKQFSEFDSKKNYNSFGNIRNPKRFKVVVLDNFQGEENKVIIVSLTRSDKPGFVKNRNRALVTLSRAKEMLVVLGNKKIFGQDCKNNTVWSTVSKAASNLSPYSMSTDECPGIAVNHCQIHNHGRNNTPAYLKTPEEIIKYRFSYCNEICNHLLPCGHRCQLRCHCRSDPPEPNEHDDYICMFQCDKMCPNNHQCQGKCGRCSRGKCPPCNVIIHHVFEKCGHEADIECNLVTSGLARCKASCGKKIDRCGHTCSLTCGHEGSCDCQVMLDAVCPNCSNPIKYKCGTSPACYRRCPHVLECGHRCSSKCIDCIKNGHNIDCHEMCEYEFTCGHKCTFHCGDRSKKHEHNLCHYTIYVGSRSFECDSYISLDPRETFKCCSCENVYSRSDLNECKNRCLCQCTRVCQKCGKRCRALTGEKCAFFCDHSELKNVKEPPLEDGPVFLFHGKHFLLIKEAIEIVSAAYNSMVNGTSDVPINIQRLRCPIKGCNYTEPCLIGSWLFDYYNMEIENSLDAIRKYVLKNPDEFSVLYKMPQTKKIGWFTCPGCKIIFTKYLDTDVFKCPNCSYEKGKPNPSE